MRTSNPTVNETKPAGERRSNFRGDIQGLRAVAVGVVVLYHFWPQRLPGGFVGVDVFFVISGFLITAHLLGRPPGRPADIATFWMRRVKRLLPASFLVILFSVLGTWIIAPETVWKDWGLQALAATFYFQNWYLATSKVDYLAEGDAPSPFQHFWSLSAEEQFYLVWPILIALFVLLAAFEAWNQQRTVFLGVSLIFVLSLSYSIYTTAVDPGVAYFSTFTRAWEFAAGALVAVLGTRAYAPKKDVLSAAAAWGGLVAIGFSAMTFNGELPFPGFVAILPVFGTMLVILANATHRFSPKFLLGWPFMRFIGDNSYALYLWHWPVLILTQFLVEDFFWHVKLLALLVSMALSVATQRLVETRFRVFMDASMWLSAPKFLMIGSTVVALAAGGFYGVSQAVTSNAKDINASIQGVTDEVGEGCLGSKSLVEDCEMPVGGYDRVAPEPVVAKEDKPATYTEKCLATEGSNFTHAPVCHFGSGEKRVALVGNSHAAQWLPALQSIADEHGWTIDTYVASRCVVMGERLSFEEASKTQGCVDYSGWVTEQLASTKYELVLSSNRLSLPIEGHSMEESAEPAKRAYERILKTWATTGAEIAVIRDTPYPGTTLDNVPDCVASHVNELADCSGPEEKWVPVDPQVDAVKSLDDPSIKEVDLTDHFCDEGTCRSVIGGLVAYFDHSHMSRTFAASLSGPLEDQLEKLVPDENLWR